MCCRASADGVVSSGEGVLDHADLRAVAVGDDDLVALLDEAQEGVGGVGDLLDLLFRGVAEGVAAEGDDDAIGLAKGLGHNCLFSSRFAGNKYSPADVLYAIYPPKHSPVT